MSDDATRTRILRVLQQIAPEARSVVLQPAVALRDQLDLDSMDVLNFVIGLHREFGVEIAERDYPRLTTIDDIVRLLTERAAVQERHP